MKYTFLTKHLWVYFGMMIFIVLISLSAFLLIVTWVITEQLNIVIKPIYLILFLVIFVSVSGTAISTFISRIILKPIAHLGRAMNQVASGDFSVQLNEEQSIEEVNKLFINFNQMVNDLNSIKGLSNDFISTVSHEFKTPLSTIRGYVQLLKKSNLSKRDQASYLNRLLDGTQQLSQLTDNILKLSKLDHDIGALEFKAFALDEQIRQVIIFLQPQWESRQIYFDLQLEPIFYLGDEDLLYQVWLNLLDNAIKYNKPGRPIQIQSHQTVDYIHIDIIDQGIGMNQETIDHIFDRFYQADSSRQTQGNGLGMALVARIIEIHHGQIHIESQLNHGSKITIILPLTQNTLAKNIQEATL